MSMSDILEAGGEVVIYLLLLSIICAVLTEGIASLIDKPANNLLEGIQNLLNAPRSTGLAEQLYNHGLIGGISQHASDPNKKTRYPSYISPTNFSLALLDILSARGIIAGKYAQLLKNGESADDVYEADVRALAEPPKNPELAENINKAKIFQEQARAALQTVADHAKAAYEEARQAVSADPGDASIVKLATRLENCVNMVNAALKMLAAQSRVVDCLKNPNEATLLLTLNASVKKTFGFARTLAAQHADPLGNIEVGLERLPEGHTKEALFVLVGKTRRDVAVIEHQAEAFRRNLEAWFNNAMEIADHWYKRWTQKVLLFITLLVVVALNVDALMLIHRHSQDSVLRESLVSASQDEVKTERSLDEIARSMEVIANSSEMLKLPIGWQLNPSDPGYFRVPELSSQYAHWVFYKVIGLYISILTIWLVAPLWLDIKNIIAMHSPGTPSGENKKNAL